MKKYKVNDNIKKLNISTYTGDITLKTGSGTINIPEDYKAFIHDGCIYIREEVEEKEEGVKHTPTMPNTWYSTKTVIVKNGKKVVKNQTSGTETVEVELNPDDEYELILKTDLGVVRVNSLNLKRLIINASVGDVVLKDIFSKNSFISTTIGNIEVEANDSILNCKTNLSTMLGTIKKESDEEVATKAEESYLKATSSTGDIKVLFKGRK